MKKINQQRVTGIILLWLSFAPGLQAQNISLKYWKAEDHSGKMSIEVSGDTLDVISPMGVTLWYIPRLTGNYEISYTTRVMMLGASSDRLSDLNCFWGANDPQCPDNLYAQSEWRQGIFQRYKSLKLFYVGYGGNNNSTTRFREYLGLGSEASDESTRPLIKEYIDEEYLLKPNCWMHICIRVEKNITTYKVDGKELFRYSIKKGQGDGNFGLRLLQNHIQMTNFKVQPISD